MYPAAIRAPDQYARLGQAHERPHRFGRLRERPPRHRKSRRAPSRSLREWTVHSLASASRRSQSRHIRWSAYSAASGGGLQKRTGAKPGAAQKFRRAHRRFAGALDFEKTQGLIAASDRQPVIENEAWLSVAAGDLTVQNLDALDAFAEICSENGAGTRRERAHEIVQIKSALGPIQIRFALAELMRVSDALFGLRLKA